MKGFLFVILLSSFYTCTANTGRLLSSCGLPLRLWRCWVHLALREPSRPGPGWPCGIF